MKCTNRLRLFTGFLCIAILLTGCGYNKYDMPYTADSKISSFSIVKTQVSKETADSFAHSLCVVEENTDSDSIPITTGTGAALFDINGRNALYSKKMFETMHPASLTKIMTSIVALNNATPDTMLTASSNVKNLEPGAQVINLNEGDKMTLDQALHILLIYSANDVAVMIAEGIGGNVDNFVNMMNEEALRIGATNSHFTNPHGLTSDDHYTTPYDLYLMMNEASKFELFNEIIHTMDYQTIYYDVAGNEKSVNISNTNQYMIGEIKAPAGITVLGGKTGTTNAAGHCLILLSKDIKSQPYISIILNSQSRDEMYQYMNALLSKIGN